MSIGGRGPQPGPAVRVVEEPADRAVLTWLSYDVWSAHRGSIACAVALWFGGATAQSTGLALLASALKAFDSSDWAPGSGPDPISLATGLLACFGLAAQFAYTAMNRTLDLVRAYLARCTARLRARLLASGALSSGDRSSRRGLLRSCSADVAASAHGVRIALEALPAVLILVVASVVLVWLHVGATLLLFVIGVPYIHHARRLAQDMASTVPELERRAVEVQPEEAVDAPPWDDLTRRRARRVTRSASTDVESELAALASKQGLRLRRFRLQGQSRWLTDVFATVALAAVLAVLALARDVAHPVGLLVAYFVVLRQALGSLHHVAGAATAAARFWPAVRRQHAAVVLGRFQARSAAPELDEDLC